MALPLAKELVSYLGYAIEVDDRGFLIFDPAGNAIGRANTMAKARLRIRRHRG